jgi:hypothetical protein
MCDSSFSTLYETVDFSLHKLTHILKSLECVNEQADPINETIDTLIGFALNQVDETRAQLLKLHKHHYDTGKNTEHVEA